MDNKKNSGKLNDLLGMVDELNELDFEYNKHIEKNRTYLFKKDFIEIFKEQKQINNSLSKILKLNTELMEYSTQKIEEQKLVIEDQKKYINDLVTFQKEKELEFTGKTDFLYSEILSLQKNMGEFIEKQSDYNRFLEEIKPIEGKSFFNKKTYSQSGEDSIIAYILKVLNIDFKDVTYIDLGANHAIEMSNSYYFYQNGAKGILVEANFNLIPELKFYRNNDIILNNVVDVKSGETLDFYILNGDGLSTMDYQSALEACEINSNLKIEEVKSVTSISYNDIVDKFLSKAPTILSIDIEGKDYEILHSIDFENKRPLLIIIEMIEYDTKLNYGTKNEKISKYLIEQEYDEYAFTGINSIFIDRRYLNK